MNSGFSQSSCKRIGASISGLVTVEKQVLKGDGVWSDSATSGRCVHIPGVLNQSKSPRKHRETVQLFSHKDQPREKCLRITKKDLSWIFPILVTNVTGRDGFLKRFEVC